MWIDPWGWACSFSSKAKRWRNSETGRFTRRPTSPAELVNNGKIDYRDVTVWARQGGLQNNWRANPVKFPTGGFRYTSGSNHIHGHGANPASPIGSNAANGPTVRITVNNKLSYRTDGTWGSYKSDINAAHISLINSPF